MKIEVVMTELDDTGAEVPFDETAETTIVPGAEISRIAKVKNTGKEAAWVRLKPTLVMSGNSVPRKRWRQAAEHHKDRR